jgi:hypothetical protein
MAFHLAISALRFSFLSDVASCGMELPSADFAIIVAKGSFKMQSAASALVAFVR